MNRDPLQMLGSMLAMVGAVLVAGRLNVYVGLWHWLLSSLLLTVWAIRWRLRWIMYMQMLFTIINIWGLFRWSDL